MHEAQDILPVEVIETALATAIDEWRDIARWNRHDAEIEAARHLL